MEINKEYCVGCGACVRECPMHSFSLKDGKADFEGNCIKCGHCYAVCPIEAIEWDYSEKPTSPLSRYIYARRSVRRFEETEISGETLRNILSRSSAYPSATNQKCVSVTVVTDKALLKEIKLDVMNNLKAKFRLLDNEYVNKAAEFVMGDNYQRAVRYKKLFDSMDEENDGITFNAPCLVFVHGNRKKICMDEDAHYFAYNVILTAMEEGLGSCFMGFIKGYMSKSLRKKLSVPNENKIYSVFVLGYPKDGFIRSVPQPMVDYRLFD